MSEIKMRLAIRPRAWARLGLIGFLFAAVCLRCGMPLRWLMKIEVRA